MSAPTFDHVARIEPSPKGRVLTCSCGAAALIDRVAPDWYEQHLKAHADD